MSNKPHIIIIFRNSLSVFTTEAINVFIPRFTPAFTMKSDISRFHGYNERISVANYVQVRTLQRNLFTILKQGGAFCRNS